MVAIRKMKYQKDGLDLRARVYGSKEYSEAIILIKPEGHKHYEVLGQIYKTRNLNWTVNEDRSPTDKVLSRKQSSPKDWVICAKKLWDESDLKMKLE